MHGSPTFDTRRRIHAWTTYFAPGVILLSAIWKSHVSSYPALSWWLETKASLTHGWGVPRGGKRTQCRGRRKVPTMSQVLSSIKYICSRKTSGSHMGRQTWRPGRHLTPARCSSHASATATCEQRRPKQEGKDQASDTYKWPGAARLDELQPSLKNVRQKIPPNDQTRLNLGFSYEKFTTQSFSVLPTPFFAQRFLGIQQNQCFALFQRRRLCDDVFSTLADEFGDLGAVFGTALKERNQTFGYKKHGGISAYRKAFLIFWRWIFKEKTEEKWSWLFFTTWISWILNFIIKFKQCFY